MNTKFCQASRGDFISSYTSSMWNPFLLPPLTFGFTEYFTATVEVSDSY